MSNTETDPAESACPAVALDDLPEPVTLAPREVPLGGPRAIVVRRTLPHRDLRTIGAWCFVDDYGPNDPVALPMAVPPHPHMGLQTVTWLLSGVVEHRDSSGGHAMVQPGDLSLMTAGDGIAHSEYNRGEDLVRGVQTWVALPSAHRGTTPTYAHHTDLPVVALGDDADATVILGEFAGATSPATTFSPIVGAEVRLLRAGEVRLPLRPEFEYGVLALDEPLVIDGGEVAPGDLHYLGAQRDHLLLSAEVGPCHVLLLGGEPLAESLLMWWNFVGRSHDEIAAARADWQDGSDRFGQVVGDPAAPLPAPALPNATLRARPGRSGRLPVGDGRSDSAESGA